MRVAIIVGNALRDLAGATLLASEVAQRGNTCYLVPQSLRQRELAALAPDYVLLDNLRKFKYDVAKQLLDAGVSVGVLDNEGGVFSSFDWYGDALNPDALVRHRISAFCSWGTRLAEHAVEQDWYKKEQVHVTGHPRFDFHASQWRNITLPGAPDSTNFKKPLVLISGRYSVANPMQQTSSKKLDRVGKRRGYDEAKQQHILTSQQRGMSQMVELVNALAARFPAVTFVYRPHPFEKLEAYYDLLKLKELPNLYLSKQGTIHGWLAIADAVIHRGCTTAIEAGMLNLPALSPRWVATPEEIESSESVSLPCSNQEEMEDRIALLERGELQRPDKIREEHKRVIHDWFYKIDGLAHQRVANAIQQSFNDASIINHTVLKQMYYEGCEEGSPRKTGLGQLVKKVFRAEFKGNEAESVVQRWDASEKRFTVEDVKVHLRAMQGGQPDFATSVRVARAEASNDYSLPMPEARAVRLSP